jgi:DNA helicase-2/ATP-dependent DNA helicase PcrA
LHVHSKYSRATSRDCDLEHLAMWARRKGIAVVATGDFTHPGWFAEIEQKLVPAEPGLFRLKPELEAEVRRQSERSAADDVRFMLEVEISTIYKKDGHTRKVHHLVYAPGLDAARRFSEALGRIGNLASDGRPILGLDSRNLLEIALQSGEGCYLVPAHIWTPWFAVLGSKSGFDRVEDCYADLSPHVFALETGLSSDPAMNWRLSNLDRYALVSNSDAHSPPKLGREACVFDCALDYFVMRRALETGEGFGGTVEFFPEEGKYHMDGHRKCGVGFEPEETRRHNGICPECGKPLTLGVMYRVCELADRPGPPDPLPARAAPFRSLIPLDEVLAELCGVGPQTNTVRDKYEDVTARLGPELFVLEQVPTEDIVRAGSPLLAEAITRMRQGRVIRQGGYDGEYGVIRLFEKEELRDRTMARVLFAPPEPLVGRVANLPEPSQAVPPPPPAPPASPKSRKAPGKPASLKPLYLFPSNPLDDLDPEQRAAAETTHGPVLIVAGPGTGKTRTLTHRVAHLIAGLEVPPEQCLALTFSRRAAGEMVERLQKLLPEVAGRVSVMTFHALGLVMLREHGARLGLKPEVRVASEEERRGLLMELGELETRPTTEAAAERLLGRISRWKRGASFQLASEGEVVEPAPASSEDRQIETLAHAYDRELRARSWLDFDDLILLPLRLLRENADLVERYRSRYRWVSVDEYQDIDAAQYELVRLLVPPNGNLCVIGDPDQAIYGFRGADVRYFQQFQADFPGATAILLKRNYRSTQTIVDAALQLIAPSSLVADRELEAACFGPERVEIHNCTTGKAEAEFVVHSIERMMGGSTFFSFDSARAAAYDGEALSFADLAVLYRTEAQADLVVEALERSGMPFQRRSHKPATDDPLALDVDQWDPRADRISLLTLHAAKGLEFPVVFIVGCEDGLLPLHWGAPDEESLAEERRLLFVGMTRAQQRLVLTHAKKRFWKGKSRPSKPSPFLEDIERTLLAFHQHHAIKKPVALDRQRALFE